MSLCSLFFTLSSSSPSFVFLPEVSRVARSGCVQLRSAGPPDKHLHSFISISLLSLWSFLFFFTLQLMFLPYFPSHTHFLSPSFQLKSWLFWTKQERLIYIYIYIFFPSNSAWTQFVLLLHQTKPTCCCKTELFVFLLLYGSCGACPIVNLNPVKLCPRCLSLHLFHPVVTSLLFSYLVFSRLFCPPISAFPHVNCSGGKRMAGLSMLALV